MVQNFINDRNLFPVWNLFQCDFTFSQTQVRNNRHHTYYSTIDHFMISENILDECIDATPIHLAENQSNHDPIYMKLRVDTTNIVINDADGEFKTRKPAWNKAKQDNILGYINELQARLSLIPYPEDALDCENVLCQNPDHKPAVDIYTIDVMEAISLSVKNNIPYTNPTSSKKIIPGWNEIVKPFKENAKFWYAIWQSAGRPQNNNLHIIMKKTRNKFHCILRKVQRREKELRKDRFITQCLCGNVNNVLQEIKQTCKQYNTPTSVDRTSGSRNIAEHFKISIISYITSTKMKWKSPTLGYD